MSHTYVFDLTANKFESGTWPVESGFYGISRNGTDSGWLYQRMDQIDNGNGTFDYVPLDPAAGPTAVPDSDSLALDLSSLYIEGVSSTHYVAIMDSPPDGVIVEGNVEPGSSVTFLMPDGSVPTTVTGAWLDSNGERVGEPDFDGNRVYIYADTQGLTLSVIVSDGIEFLTFEQVMPAEPYVHAFWLGAHGEYGEQGLPVYAIVDGANPLAAEISWSSRVHWAQWGDDFTSTPGVDWMDFQIAGGWLGLDPSLDLSGATAQFRIDDGSSATYVNATMGRGPTSTQTFQGYLRELSFDVGADGDSVEFDVQLVINDQPVGDPKTLTVTFDHSAPQGHIHAMDAADISSFDKLETAALFFTLDAAKTAVFVDFNEVVRVGGGWLDMWGLGAQADEMGRSWFSSPTGDTVSAVWVRLPEGNDSYYGVPGDWVNLSAADYPGDYVFDAAIVLSDALDAEFVFKKPVNVQDVTASAPVETGTTFYQDFVITGYDGLGVRELEGDVFNIGVWDRMFVGEYDPSIGDYSVPALDSINLTWSSVSLNELTGEFQATVTLHAEHLEGLTLAQIANLKAVVTAQSISQTVVDMTSTMLVDRAGNLFDGNITDPTVVITPTSLTDVVYEPATGTGGWDTLDLTALGGGTEVQVEYASVYSGSDVFLIADFSSYVLSARDNWFEGGDSKGHVVYLEGSGFGNSIAGGAWINDGVTYEYVASGVGGVSVNLSATPVTNDGDTRDWIEVTRAEGVDYITGIEFFGGSNAADTISGTAGFEILGGNGGDDVVTGNGSASAATGGDLLVGGSGVADTLIGSSDVVDILVDIDGGTMQGRDTAWQSGDSQSKSDHDVFVVRDSATINNFALSSDQAHLSGRSNQVADRITFALSTTAVVMAALDYYNPAHGLNATDPDFLMTADVEASTKRFVKERLSVEQSVVGDDLVLTLTDGTNNWGDVTLAGVAATLGTSGGGAQVIRLDKYEASRFDTIDYAAEELSATETGAEARMVAENMIREFLEDNILSGDEIHVPIALESVIAGTVGDTAPGKVMAASLGLLETDNLEFVPGYADQDLLGGRGNDRYKFVVQNFSEESGGIAGDAGSDTVLDVGGADNVWLGAATIDDLTVEAFRAGREKSANSLWIDYEQHDANGLVNQGNIKWLGAFRDGGRTALETITVSGGDTNNDGFVDQADALVSYAVARADYDLAVFDGSASFDPAVPETVVEAGRSFVVDASGDSNWIVAGNHGDTDILRISGVQAAGEVGDVRIWGFGAGDVVDVSAWLADNAAYFTDSPMGPITTGEQYATWAVSLDENLVVTDTADEKSFAVYSDAVGGATPVHLATIYFMDLEESVDSVVLYAG